MKVLIVGNGGREHTLARTLLESPNVEQIFCTPGNGGTATMEGCQNLPLSVEDFEGIAKAALKYEVSLVVVGPELPLSLGIADYLGSQNIMVFGPSKAGAQIEASKSWAKDLMKEAGVPTAKSEVFTEAELARAFVARQGAPIVIKADGLAAGKGVTVAMSVGEAEEAIDAIFANNFNKVLIEEYLTGEEVSILALTDGLTIRPLLPSQDHKRIGEGDTGKNTGGMGAYAPVPIATTEIIEKVEKEILQPTLEVLQKRGIDYRGVLYAGLMITPQGQPKVIEFNCRFGDPETQAILPLLETPLDELLLACTRQRLAQQPPIRWKKGSAVCVVLAAAGYPDAYGKGMEISGIEEAIEKGAIVFHAGTRIEDGKLVTDGGRVLGVTAASENFASAIALAYRSIEPIYFKDMYYRRDIGYRVRSK